MRGLHQRAAGLAMLAISVCFAVPGVAWADNQPDLAAMAAALKRLEARVAALEDENKQAKSEVVAARAEARALREQVATASHSTVGRPATITTTIPAAVGGAYAKAPSGPPVEPGPTWAGPYAGAAFGAGWLRGSGDQTTPSVITSSTVSTSTTPPSSSSSSITQTTDSGETLRGRDMGAMVNLLIGYNLPVGDRVIVGGQFEGGLSNIRVNLRGSGSSTTTSVSVSAPPPSSSTTVFPESFSSADTLDSRWTMSALGRVGVLVDPSDLLYAIGGYTYAHLDAFTAGFGLNGGTAGAGWERQIAPGWTVRGEYRYTAFQSKDVSLPTTFNSVSSSSSGNFTFSSAASESVLQTNHVTADMHSFWLSVVHNFGT